MTETTARYQAVRRCVTCHERLTDDQVWGSKGVCPHCGDITGGLYSRYCDTYTTSELRDSSPELRAFETAARRGLEVRGLRLLSLTPARCDGVPAWEACIEVRSSGLKAKLTLGSSTDDPYAAPESFASDIAAAVAAPKRALVALAEPPVPVPVHGTFINDLRLLLADLGISAMWRAGLTRVRRLLTVGVRLR